MRHHFRSEEVVGFHQELAEGYVTGYPAPSIYHQPVAYLGFHRSS
jgi:hypothetical protein